MTTEREKIISLADDAGFSTIDDEYGGIQVTDSGNKWITERLVAFYHKAQREAFEQAAKLIDERFDECEPWICGDDIRQLIKE